MFEVVRWDDKPRAKLVMSQRGKTMNDVAARVKNIIVERLGVAASKVTDNANLRDDMSASSLDTWTWYWGSRKNSAARFPMLRRVQS